MDILSLELRKLGLKEKEARVYLAGLELGANSVQNIAKKAGITRPTTYEILKNLQAKGLSSQTKEGGKRYFVAQSPEKILDLLRLQKRELEEKEREFIRIIARLESRYAFKESGVQMFRGKEGIDILKEQILFTPTKDIMVFTSETGKAKVWCKAIEQRLGKLSLRERCVPHLGGILFLGNKTIFISSQKQEGYLIDNPLVVHSLKSLFSSIA